MGELMLDRLINSADPAGPLMPLIKKRHGVFLITKTGVVRGCGCKVQAERRLRVWLKSQLVQSE
jgi:hypothetical protein